MKKIISLLIATALSVTAFTSFVSAAQITSSNKATLAISVAEIDEGDALEDLTAFVEEAELEDYSFYQVTVTAGNLPALSKSSTKYTGEGITAVAARMVITTDAEYEAEWMLAAPAGKGSFVNSGDNYVFNYAAANDYKKLLVAAAVTEGASQDIATFQIVVDNNYSYNIVLDGGSNMNAAVFSSATSAKGTDPYDISAAFSNITVDSTPIVLNGEPDTQQYTITFRNYNNSADVEVQTVDEGDTITPPTAPERSGYTFAYWSEAVDGAEATIGTASADKIYYAVYTEDAPEEEIIAPVENKVDAQDKGTTALTDLSGNPVGEFKNNYGIAKFDTAITTGEKDYFVVATDDATPEANTKEWKIDFAELGVEAENATVSFFALVKSATHKIVSVGLKAVAK
jgi:hypothetical protein